MSGYLALAKRSRARRERSEPRPAAQVVTNPKAAQQSRPIHLGPEGHELEAAGFKPKERCGKIIWQRPDTGFWVSQEMALHILKYENVEEEWRV